MKHPDFVLYTLTTPNAFDFPTSNPGVRLAEVVSEVIGE